MNINNIHTVYLLGVGGIGMSALARYFLIKGCKVYGYDKTKTSLTEELEAEGIAIHYDENVSLIPDAVKNNKEGILVVYTPAIPKNNKELLSLQQSGIKLYKRSEVLGLISQEYFTIAVAGTHGKTTTSSMIAHVLNECGVKCNAFLGGISLNFNSNLLLNEDAKIVVVEADEFDRSFLTLTPNIAIVTSLDADHLDVYKNKNEMHNAYKAFVEKINPTGTLITKQTYLTILQSNNKLNTLTYSIERKADYALKSKKVEDGNFLIEVETPTDVLQNMVIGLPGIHNIENGLAAFVVADLLKIDRERIKAALKSYKGVKRRFEFHIKTNDLVYIDDYAHHPTELTFAISSIKELYPNKKITGVFQPHLYSRTRDFADEFAESLSLLDELILLDIYPARELSIEGVSSAMLLEKVTIQHKKLVQKEEVLSYFKTNQPEVLVTLGAGDIDTLVQPLKTMLNAKAVNY
jgi:UDP-N-acetylmuramate--alanine ligase|tara:strand:- start:163997 stop:165388 length:1392 start_codon:yes stop_codon:yes gene_type:complete